MANGMVRVRREAFERDGGVACCGLENRPVSPGPRPAGASAAAAKAPAAVAFGDFSRVADAAEDDAHGVPAKAGMTFEDALASARAAAAAAAARGGVGGVADRSNAVGVVVVPAHGARGGSTSVSPRWSRRRTR